MILLRAKNIIVSIGIDTLHLWFLPSLGNNDQNQVIASNRCGTTRNQTNYI